ncbi:MAG: bifunctional diaminohydroxyphosphoribosylaminopyrimidine deaminase/5-amino-6-(5-phosphoribosylamino)uracil reductase RibD [Phycisphaeraceae bacterium]
MSESKTNKTLEKLMRKALKLALRGQGRVEPNPMVGCVIARDGKPIAQGFHHKFAGPHAEIDAIESAKKKNIDIAGCDWFLTLEPCTHAGKTPPCIDAVIAAKPARVFIAMQDPFPQVNGQGIAKLLEAGIAVEVGLCKDEARQLNRPFIKRVTTGLPWVIGKWAQTIDGRIATRTGDSKWISSAKSRQMVHELRARVDAILVGIGTVLQDDPLLTARDVTLKRIALRVIIDPLLRLAVDHQVLDSVGKDKRAGKVIIGARAEVVASHPPHMEQLQSRGVEIVPLPVADMNTGRLALRPLLKHLADKHNVTNILLEGGGHLIGAMLVEDMIDEALIYIAPKILGDEYGRACAMGQNVPRMADAKPLPIHDVTRIDDDVLLHCRVH